MEEQKLRERRKYWTKAKHGRKTRSEINARRKNVGRKSAGPKSVYEKLEDEKLFDEKLSLHGISGRS